MKVSATCKQGRACHRGTEKQRKAGIRRATGKFACGVGKLVAGRGDGGRIEWWFDWAIGRVRFLDDHCDRLQGNGSKRGTRGQLVEVPVEVQLARDCWESIACAAKFTRS